ncbi:3'-5' exonuclease [Streptomyces sp. NPDC007205]|uniref:3'-5' exonuclease n=1 Tax=Streptomyces sp. NPDC007205 TaxID=3154316 RepID=UPI0033E6F8BB
MTLAEPNGQGDLFSSVDEHEVQLVRPAGTSRPIWAVYGGGRYLGTVSAERDGNAVPVWRVLATREEHDSLDDAIRAMRRPPSWRRERERVSRWARHLLADDSLLAVDLETTGLDNAYMVQIAVMDRDESVLLDEYVRPRAAIEPAALEMHGITQKRVARAATFGELLPALTDVLHGRTLVSYNSESPRAVFQRELVRHHGDPVAAAEWLARCRWKDAMMPYSVWRGLWSVERGAYRSQPLGGPHDAAVDCQFVLAKLRQMADGVPDDGWALSWDQPLAGTDPDRRPLD